MSKVSFRMRLEIRGRIRPDVWQRSYNTNTEALTLLHKRMINKGIMSQRVINKRMARLNTHAGPMCSGEQEA